MDSIFKTLLLKRLHLLIMSLCFLEAFRQWQSGKITVDEYLDHIVPHCRGQWLGPDHEQDEDGFGSNWFELENEDLFGFSIWRWTKHMESTQDIVPFKKAFKAYFDRDMKELHDQISLLRPADAKSVRSSLAIIALRDERADVVKYCLDEGFNWNSWFLDAANSYEKINKKTDITKILHESQFRVDWPWPIPKPKRSAKKGEIDFAAFDYGGRYAVNW
ncbi:hypothetical protein BT63DRAFT_437435 [Microthyrium microscopicum]|uniref:Uncharacterized protein n=1 Tax=Microthyrium microscopicum TaxID=703497 RepID=A0A6A6USD0_9PEZI|nr:hypothetical protein BT63DRAFT_437435 [Microthyrium microscopicum]